MEECEGGYRLSGIVLRKAGAGLAVPGNLVRVDVAPALDACGIVAVTAVKKVKDALQSFRTGEREYVVFGQVDAAGKGTDQLVHLFPGQVEVAVMVAERYGERNAAFFHRP